MSKSSGDLKRHVRTHTKHTQVDTLQNVFKVSATQDTSAEVTHDASPDPVVG